MVNDLSKDSVQSKQGMEDSRKCGLEFKSDPVNSRELGGWYHQRGMWKCLYLSVCEKHFQRVPRKTVSASFSPRLTFPLLCATSRSLGLFVPPSQGDRSLSLPASWGHVVPVACNLSSEKSSPCRWLECVLNESTRGCVSIVSK